jgi:hypothetical protein
MQHLNGPGDAQQRLAQARLLQVDVAQLLFADLVLLLELGQTRF